MDFESLELLGFPNPLGNRPGKRVFSVIVKSKNLIWDVFINVLSVSKG